MNWKLRLFARGHSLCLAEGQLLWAVADKSRRHEMTNKTKQKNRKKVEKVEKVASFFPGE
jgi:hypothetical protein